MKKLLASAAVVAILAGISVLQAQELSPVPSYSAVKEINLRGEEGTVLRIFPNGSGSLTSGSSEMSKFPKHTFSFANVYQTLAGNLARVENRERTIGYVPPPSSDVTYNFFIQDQHIINRLLSEAGVR
jgi:hypothetical protein